MNEPRWKILRKRWRKYRRTHWGLWLYPGAELTANEVEFGAAMDKWQRRWGVRYPTWAQVLAVFKSLGWRK